MNLRLTGEQEAFRRAVCQLLCEEQVGEEVARARRLPVDEEPGLLEVYRRLGERGWLAVNWPAEHGGLGTGIVEKAILTEEMILHGIPDVVHTLSVDIVGLAIQRLGTEEQKRQWLPPIAAGDSVGCVLLSEPEVGSDLGSLSTRAEPDGDGWRLYGRKVYNLKSQFADLALCAARTTSSDVRFHGITVFIVPMRTPGIRVEPVPSISDERFNEVVLSGIRMTRQDVLGEVDDGWQVLNGLLGLERTGIEFEAKARRLLDAVLDEAERTGALEAGGYGERLVELDAEVRAGRLLSWRALGSMAADTLDDVQCAMAKWHTTETAKLISELSPEICGLTALLSARDEQAPPGWLLESDLRDAPGRTLASGTSEMMLSLIASAGLGLLR
ncbi:MAG TPA: acyl-CoA dehydrogenase family protein [Jatrophihabitans sp.]|uniref:acyl-CoA dehydrogenase family protein n=1 Tax=Jatrophihabitans sp. TaxID=1932789 RepID=UPI002EEDEFC7